MAEKKSKETTRHPNWHPDFRDSEVLPDVKAVRTNFLVNFVALALAVVLVGVLVFSEYQAMTVSSAIADEEEKIAAEAPSNREYLKLSAQFEKLSPKAEDLENFYAGYLSPLEVTLALSESRPETIALQSIDFRASRENTGSAKRPKYVRIPVYTIKGMLRGDSAEALDELDNYAVLVRDLEVFKDNLESVEVSRPTRNQLLGLFEFTIVVNLKPAS